MQDLASEFSKISAGDTPDPHSGRGRPFPAPNTQPGPGVGTQTLVSLNFSAVVAPLPIELPLMALLLEKRRQRATLWRRPRWISISPRIFDARTDAIYSHAAVLVNHTVLSLGHNSGYFQKQQWFLSRSVNHYLPRRFHVALIMLWLSCAQARDLDLVVERSWCCKRRLSPIIQLIFTDV